jgi:purine-binding chemotaxis protein CheW
MQITKDTSSATPGAVQAGVPERENGRPLQESCAGDASQYLTFRLSREIYAVNVANIKEILEFCQVTQIPRTPDYMRGVINLRGNVVPVIDMRLKLGMPSAESTIDTCIIVMEICAGNDTMMVGALADSVLEVLELDSGAMEEAPAIGTGINSGVIKAMAKNGDDFIMILDIDEVFDLGGSTLLSESEVA